MGQVSACLRRMQNGYAHWCPGCESMHGIATDAPQANGARWSFNGDVNAPSFSPSINIRWGRFVDPTFDDSADPKRLSGVCHYFLTAGQIQFCADSTHALSGKTVPLPPLPPELTDEAP